MGPYTNGAPGENWEKYIKYIKIQENTGKIQENTGKYRKHIFYDFLNVWLVSFFPVFRIIWAVSGVLVVTVGFVAKFRFWHALRELRRPSVSPFRDRFSFLIKKNGGPWYHGGRVYVFVWSFTLTIFSSVSFWFALVPFWLMWVWFCFGPVFTRFGPCWQMLVHLGLFQ